MSEDEQGAHTMKALSLWQPWASLVALGVKTIETRSWATNYRGPLAIHAAKTSDGIDDLPGDCEGKTEGDWVYGYIGDYQAAYCRRSGDEGRRGDAEISSCSDGTPLVLKSVPLPFGALVATCLLIDVVPIRGVEEPIRTAWEKHVAPIRRGPLWLWHGPSEVENPSTGRPTWRTSDITDQHPYGDYTPGRFAWLLSDIVPIEPPIPARGRQQLWTFPVPPGSRPDRPTQ